MRKSIGKKGAEWDTIAIIIGLFALGIFLYFVIKWVVIGGGSAVPSNPSDVAKTVLP
jgi:hypothetical protein